MSASQSFNVGRLLVALSYGLGSAVNVLAFTVIGEGFPPEAAARANTALNLLLFTSSFAAQWGIGVIVDAARAALGIDIASALNSTLFWRAT